MARGDGGNRKRHQALGKAVTDYDRACAAAQYDRLDSLRERIRQARLEHDAHPHRHGADGPDGLTPDA